MTIREPMKNLTIITKRTSMLTIVSWNAQSSISRNMIWIVCILFVCPISSVRKHGNSCKKPIHPSLLKICYRVASTLSVECLKNMIAARIIILYRKRWKEIYWIRRNCTNVTRRFYFQNYFLTKKTPGICLQIYGESPFSSFCPISWTFSSLEVKVRHYTLKKYQILFIQPWIWLAILERKIYILCWKRKRLIWNILIQNLYL